MHLSDVVHVQLSDPGWWQTALVSGLSGFVAALATLAGVWFAGKNVKETETVRQNREDIRVQNVEGRAAAASFLSAVNRVYLAVAGNLMPHSDLSMNVSATYAVVLVSCETAVSDPAIGLNHATIRILAAQQRGDTEAKDARLSEFRDARLAFVNAVRHAVGKDPLELSGNEVL